MAFDKKEYQRKWREQNPTYFRDKKREAYKKNREKILAQNKAWRDRNGESVNSYEKARIETKRNYSREWRERNPERAREAVRQYAANNRSKIAKQNRSWRLKTSYGLTQQDVDRLSRKQRGKCWICKQVPEKGLVVDHDHETNKVRALLCHSCNRALGLLGDDSGRVSTACRYLRLWSKRHTVVGR